MRRVDENLALVGQALVELFVVAAVEQLEYNGDLDVAQGGKRELEYKGTSSLRPGPFILQFTVFFYYKYPSVLFL